MQITFLQFTVYIFYCSRDSIHTLAKQTKTLDQNGNLSLLFYCPCPTKGYLVHLDTDPSSTHKITNTITIQYPVYINIDTDCVAVCQSLEAILDQPKHRNPGSKCLGGMKSELKDKSSLKGTAGMESAPSYVINIISLGIYTLSTLITSHSTESPLTQATKRNIACNPLKATKRNIARNNIQLRSATHIPSLQ